MPEPASAADPSPSARAARAAERPALVTGASRGIGRAAALALSLAGHPVAVSARGEAELQQTTELAAAAGGAPVVVLAADANDLDACAALPGQAEEQLGAPPAILVHAAGICRPCRLEKLSVSEWEETMRINVTSALVLAQTCLPAMRAAHWGRVLTVGSLTSRTGPVYLGAYASTKHALFGLTRVISAETAAFGITANCVLPGWTDTEMLSEALDRLSGHDGTTREEALQRLLRNQPMGRAIGPEEVGELIAFLASEGAGAITGQGINIDGGEIQS